MKKHCITINGLFLLLFVSGIAVAQPPVSGDAVNLADPAQSTNVAAVAEASSDADSGNPGDTAASETMVAPTAAAPEAAAAEATTVGAEEAAVVSTEAPAAVSSADDSTMAPTEAAVAESTEATTDESASVAATEASEATPAAGDAAATETVEMEGEAAAEKVAAEEVVPPPPSPFQLAVDGILRKDGKRQVKLDNSETVFHKRQILRLYEENGYKPLWKRDAKKSLAAALDSMADDGLNPADYRFEEIVPYFDDPSLVPASLQEEVRADILFTEAYLRALYNLRFGKVDPYRLDGDHNYSKTRSGEDRTAQRLAWIQQAAIDQAVDEARPRHEQYVLLNKALKRYRKYAEGDNWKKIPGGRAIKPGKLDRRIALIRERLAMSG